jgi:FlaA1/EpsC-like NDP-sugar epimerase
MLSNVIGLSLTMIVFDVLHIGTIPRSVLLISWLLILFMLGGVRFAHRIYTIYLPAQRKRRKRALIVGAGNSGEMIVRQINREPQLGYVPVCFVDDDVTKKGNRIHGVPVSGTIKDIPELVKSRRIEEIIIAVPSATAKQMRRVVEYCEKSSAPFRTLPGAKELMNGQITLSKIRRVRIEDLLERSPYVTDKSSLITFFENKNVVITGAAGSIGSELSRQLSRLNPKTILFIDQAESALFDLRNELADAVPQARHYLFEILDITNFDRLKRCLLRYEPDIVFHAAAYKHVPLMEAHPDEAVLNNIQGTMNVSQAAALAGATQFINVSTDKAVNPTNIMGTTKRLIELYCMSQNGESQLKHSVVRFGNVLGSNGSVVPLFQKQIRNGGPVTVTSKEITRYFMTIPEAVELVLQASLMGKGGEIFVLDMGEPIRIYDMARHLISLSGLEPDKDIKIEVTGLRPGEKLVEELWSKEEKPESTQNPQIKRVIHNPGSHKELICKKTLEQLFNAANQGDHEEIFTLLNTLVPNAELNYPIRNADPKQRLQLPVV